MISVRFGYDIRAPDSAKDRSECQSLRTGGKADIITSASCANTVKSCSGVLVDCRQFEHELTGSCWWRQNAKRRVDLSTGGTVQVEYF